MYVNFKCLVSGWCAMSFLFALSAKWHKTVNA